MAKSAAKYVGAPVQGLFHDVFKVGDLVTWSPDCPGASALGSLHGDGPFEVVGLRRLHGEEFERAASEQGVTVRMSDGSEKYFAGQWFALAGKDIRIGHQRLSQDDALLWFVGEMERCPTPVHPRDSAKLLCVLRRIEGAGRRSTAAFAILRDYFERHAPPGAYDFWNNVCGRRERGNRDSLLGLACRYMTPRGMPRLTPSQAFEEAKALRASG